ncbi:MAG: AraC family transcriptional regulator [Candidatus Humimicrobiaceae bacterium]
MINKKRINLELSKNSHWVTSRDLKVTLGGKHNINFDKNLPLIINPVHFYIDYTMTSNYHDYLEITYVLDGNGKFIIGSKKYPARKGDIFVINNVELHAVIADHNQSINLISFYFLPELIYKPGDNEVNLKLLNLFYCQSNNFSHRIPGRDVPDNIVSLIYSIYKTLKNKNNYYDIATKTYLQEILLSLLYYYDDKISNSKTVYTQNLKGIERLREVFFLIINNYDRKVKLEEVTKAACMSTQYFCKFFKKVTGSTFKEYLISIRIDKAKELLLKNNSTITEIAYQVGFENLSYFYRVFKRFTKLNPSGFRSIIRSKK